MQIEYEIRHAAHPSDVKKYDTQQLRQHFLIGRMMEDNLIRFVYSLYDRFIAGGAVPVDEPLELMAVDALKAPFFLHRRELGIINVGGPGIVIADEHSYPLKFKEALYLGSGERNPVFRSQNPMNPARFYFNSAPAHQSFPDKKIDLSMADTAELGSLETSNARKINKLLIHTVVQTCQLQMGLTELKPGSVWNTMPAHTHARRMETYFYFGVPEGQAVCHFMGEPGETRHIWMQNEQAVISPPWSIHSAAGTSNYSFIWGMAGENLDYSDMDSVPPDQLR